MTAESTAVLLRRAATRLDELAAPLADHGRWEAEPDEHDDEEWVIATEPPFRGGVTIDGQWTAAEELREPVALWAALLGPQVAVPMAALLRSLADSAEAVDEHNAATRARAVARGGVDGSTYSGYSDEVGRGVALARALLGETETRDDR